MDNSPKQVRVAILGGGAGAISAAFWLSRPELNNRFKISVYTHGWRLGGKAASGRNCADHSRIQEHGLHVLFGFHENLFETLRLCYEELPNLPDNRFNTPMDAVWALREVTMMQSVPDNPTGTWEPWHFSFLPLPGTPGDGKRFEFNIDVVKKIADWIQKELLRNELLTDTFPPEHPRLRELGEALSNSLSRFAVSENRILAGFLNPLEPLRQRLRKRILAPLRQSLESFRQSFRSTIEPLVTGRPGGFKLCTLLELALAILIGYVTDVVPYGEAGFDRINDLEFRDWLLSHGAQEKYTWTAPVRCLYDLGFAFEHSDSSLAANGKLAAGVTLKVVLLLTLGYKDAPLFRTRAAMGEVIFAPLYRLLKERGVDFHFFNRLSKLTCPDGSSLSHIELLQQVELTQRYDPIFISDGIWCWPDQPLWDQIENSESIKKEAWDTESVYCTHHVGSSTLRWGHDFDVAILGIPPAGLPAFGRELRERKGPMRDMYENLSWVPTQSVQIWLKDSVTDLGSTTGPVMLTYVEPFSSSANWNHLIQVEKWPAPVKSLVFFCGTYRPVSDPKSDINYPMVEQQHVHQTFMEWLNKNAARLWPRSVNDAGFDASLIVSGYYRANIDPSEMYVQSLPGSIAHRLPPDGSGIENLFLAGDWTTSRINAGSVECAFESGRNAAQAIIRKFA